MLRYVLCATTALLASSWLNATPPAMAADDEEVIVLSRATAVDYAVYQRADHQGFFAISLDGETSAHVAHDGEWTDEAVLAPLAGRAIADCEAEANGKTAAPAFRAARRVS